MCACCSNVRRLIFLSVYYVQGVEFTGTPYLGKTFSNLYQANITYPFTKTKSIRFSTGVRSDNTVVFADVIDASTQFSLKFPNQKTLYSMSKLEFVYDNSLNMAQNIWHGERAKIYAEWNRQINKDITQDGPNTFNFGFDGRYYHSIYRNFIWAGRVAGDFSFGDQKLIYYLGGVDGWLMFGANQKANGADRYFNTNNPPSSAENYSFQSLAVNMRGFIQNIANGSNSLVINSEFRLPVFTTIFDRTINSSFIRNFQVTQFIDLGTAWNGSFDKIKRPEASYFTGGATTVRVKAGGIGPLAGGYGFGARTSVFGYFVKFDKSWQMNGFFKGKAQNYFSLGLDF